jgi:hypothetical protein
MASGNQRLNLDVAIKTTPSSFGARDQHTARRLILYAFINLQVAHLVVEMNGKRSAAQPPMHPNQRFKQFITTKSATSDAPQ